MYRYVLLACSLVAIAFLVLRDKQPVVATAEGIVRAPIARVWDVQTNLSAWPTWNHEVQTISVHGPIGVGAKFVWKAGGITITSTITEFEPYRRIAWRGVTTGITAYHTWDFTEVDGAVRVRTEEQFAGPLAWLLPGTMRNQIRRALRHGVNALTSASETSSPTSAPTDVAG